MSKPSGSALERFLACPASQALPHATSDSKPAARGIAIHRFLQKVGDVGREEALADVEGEWLEICTLIDIDALPTELGAEVTFAVDVVTGKGRELGRDLDRDYSAATENELCGTIDVVGVAEDFVYIGDYKSGRIDPTVAERNAQLLFAALGACLAYGKDAAVCEIIRIKEDGTSWRDVATFSIFVLEAFLVELAAAYKKFRSAEKLVALGKSPPVHAAAKTCKYCPAKGDCPERIGLARYVVANSETMVAGALDKLTPENYREFFEKAELIKQISAELQKAKRQFAIDHGPLELSDGTWYGENEKLGNEEIDNEVAHQVLVELHGFEVANDAAKKTYTKAGMKRAAKAHGIKPVAAFEREVMEEIRKRDGARRQLKTVVEVFEKKKEMKA